MKRATALASHFKGGTVHFNPRPREEGDEVTLFPAIRTIYFNPRPREEGDVLLLMFRSRFQQFQSTPS